MMVAELTEVVVLVVLVEQQQHRQYLVLDLMMLKENLLDEIMFGTLVDDQLGPLNHLEQT